MDTCTSVFRENQSHSSEIFQFILTRKTAFHKIKGYFRLAYRGNKFTTSTKNSQFCDPPLPPSTKTNNRSFQDPHLPFMWQSQTNGSMMGKLQFLSYSYQARAQNYKFEVWVGCHTYKMKNFPSFLYPTPFVQFHKSMFETCLMLSLKGFFNPLCANPTNW